MATGRLPDPNTAPLTAKGDLYTYSTVPARLAVGSNGDTLVADSSATTGLRWQGNFAAGKNKLINGDFNINQRGFTSTTTTATYGFDRFQYRFTGGTNTYSAQTFTPGSAPVAGYESTNFARIATTGQSATGDFCYLLQRIEDVRTLAGQTATISFWAKASSGTPNVGVSLEQSFGAGGSSLVVVNAGVSAITTSWARYSFTVAVPSVSGKTIGANSLIAAGIFTSAGTGISGSGYPAVGIQNTTIDIWGVQVEAGNTATAFQTATGTLAGELAACQRYYYRTTASAAYSAFQWVGPASSTTAIRPVGKINTMRITPTSIDWGNLAFDDEVGALIVPSAITLSSNSTPDCTLLLVTVTGATSARWYKLVANNNSAAFIGFSAEL